MDKSCVALRPIIVTLLALAMAFGLLTPFALAQGATGTAGIEFQDGGAPDPPDPPAAPVPVVVTFIRNWNIGDNTVVATVPFYTGTEITANHLPEPGPSPPNRRFISWTLAPGGGAALLGQTITRNIRVYAQWTPEQFTVTFAPRGGTFRPGELMGGTVTGGMLVHSNVNIGTNPATLAPTNLDRIDPHLFMGWHCADTGRSLSQFPQVYRDMTFIAFWSPFVRFVPHDGEFNPAGFAPAQGLILHPSPDNIQYVHIEVSTGPNGRGPFALVQPMPTDANKPRELAQIWHEDFPDTDNRLRGWYRRNGNDWRENFPLSQTVRGLMIGSLVLPLEGTFEIVSGGHMALTVHSRWRREIPFIPNWPPDWEDEAAREVIPLDADRLASYAPPLPSLPTGVTVEWWFVDANGRFISPVDPTVTNHEVPEGAVLAAERRQVRVQFVGGTGSLLNGDMEFMVWANGGAHQVWNNIPDTFRLNEIYDFNGMPRHGSHEDDLEPYGWMWRTYNPTVRGIFRYRDFPSAEAMYEYMLYRVDLATHLYYSEPVVFEVLWDGDETPRPELRQPEAEAPVTPTPETQTHPQPTPEDSSDVFIANPGSLEYNGGDPRESRGEGDEPNDDDDTIAVYPGQEPPGTPPTQPPGSSDYVPPSGDASGAGTASWALLNLVMTVFCAIGFVAFIVLALVSKRRRDENSEEYADETGYQHQGNEAYAAETGYQAHGENEENEDSEPMRRRGIILMAVIGILAVASVVLFILTQNIRFPMVISDRWTAAHLMLLAGSVLVYLIRFGRRGPKDSESVDESEFDRGEIEVKN